MLLWAGIVLWRSLERARRPVPPLSVIPVRAAPQYPPPRHNRISAVRAQRGQPGGTDDRVAALWRHRAAGGGRAEVIRPRQGSPSGSLLSPYRAGPSRGSDSDSGSGSGPRSRSRSRLRLLLLPGPGVPCVPGEPSQQPTNRLTTPVHSYPPLTRGLAAVNSRKISAPLGRSRTHSERRRSHGRPRSRRRPRPVEQLRALVRLSRRLHVVSCVSLLSAHCFQTLPSLGPVC